MGSVGTAYTSGDWHVSEGKVNQFIATWNDMITWTLDGFGGARSFELMQQDNDERHFISVGEWDSKESVGKWRANPEFQNKLAAARALCDEFAGLDYTSVATHP